MTPIFYKNNLFKINSHNYPYNFPKNLRLCIDYIADYKFINSLVKSFPNNFIFQLKDIIDLVSRKLNLISINSFLVKKGLYK